MRTGNKRTKYLVDSSGTGRCAAQELREQGYEVVITEQLPPEAAGQAAVQEDVNRLLVPDRYDEEDVETLVDTLEQYGREDLRLEMVDGRYGYLPVPTDWWDVAGVGEQTYDVLEDTELKPWDADRDRLEEALLDGYGDGHVARTVSGRVASQNVFFSRDGSRS